MGAPKEFTAANFDAMTKKGNVVVDFWASWCGPCKIVSPILEQVAAVLHDKVAFGKVNVDNEYELAERFEIMAVPSLLFFKDGELIDRITGALSKDELVKRAKEAFSLN
jgi:thioredoxin 1